MPHVFAYLDLASGSMIVQAVIAGIVVVPVLFRNKIRSLLGRGKPVDDAPFTSDMEVATQEAGADASDTDAS
jgi:hypothetical protein